LADRGRAVGIVNAVVHLFDKRRGLYLHPHDTADCGFFSFLNALVLPTSATLASTCQPSVGWASLTYRMEGVMRRDAM
jgi:hypothetical protein